MDSAATKNATGNGRGWTEWTRWTAIPVSLRLIAAFALFTFAAAQPAPAQNWLQRYLRDHRPKAAGSGTQSSDSGETKSAPASQEPEIRRAVPADGSEAPAADPAAPPASAVPPEATPAPQSAPASTPAISSAVSIVDSSVVR